MIDRTHTSPVQYRRRTRRPDEVDLVVLHQTGPVYRADDVRAHFLVEPSGDTLRLHDPLTRLRYGSGHWNARCVTIEHGGNFPGRYTSRGMPVWWRPDLGTDTLGGAQVFASRALLRHLAETLPALKYIAAHRMIERGKGGCCGPDLWREVGEWALDVLGLELVEVASTGSPLPSTWRQPPHIIEPATPTNRTYTGPLAV